MSKVHHLFSVTGVELEYMIVNRDTLNVLPIADEILKAVANDYVNEVEFGDMGWSNELARHLIEIKTLDPVANLTSLPAMAHQHIVKINQWLADKNAMLLPTGAHPWMNPWTETKLWPHGDPTIYNTYDRIFDCRGHGWSNLQSMHLNLPYANEQEFHQLHTAIRLLLPIMPALTASTPILEGKVTDIIDTRLSFYGSNQKKIPEISGQLIPEYMQSPAEYAAKILKPMYHAIAAEDSDKILQDEWLNSRAAIPRFERDAIEIRILDTQECPLADISCASAIIAVLKNLVAERWASLKQQADFDTLQLRKIFDDAWRYGQRAEIREPNYLKALGYPKPQADLKQVWEFLIANSTSQIASREFESVLDLIITNGNLSERILSAIGTNHSHANIKQVYNKLAMCLSTNQIFKPNG